MEGSGGIGSRIQDFDSHGDHAERLGGVLISNAPGGKKRVKKKRTSNYFTLVTARGMSSCWMDVREHGQHFAKQKQHFILRVRKLKSARADYQQRNHATVFRIY